MEEAICYNLFDIIDMFDMIVLRKSWMSNNVWKIKTVLTRNNLIKYWKLSIGMCQSSSVNDECYESDRIRRVERCQSQS